MNPIVEEILQTLPDDLREEWEERAAIMEFDGGLSRSEGEALALLCVLRKFIPNVPREKEDLI